MNSPTLLIIAAFHFGRPVGPGYSRLMNYARAVRDERGASIRIYSLFCTRLGEIPAEVEIEPGICFVGQAEGPVAGLLARLRRAMQRRAHFKAFLNEIGHEITTCPGLVSVLYVPMLHEYWTEKMALRFFMATGVRVVLEKNEMEQAIVLHPMRYNRWIDNGLALLKFPWAWLRSFTHDRLIQQVTGVVAISTRIEQWAKRYCKCVVRIPILMDDVNYQSTRAAHTSLRIGYTGAISEQKDGVLTLVRMINELLEEGLSLELHLYGPATNREKRALGQALGKGGNLGKIVYHGVLPSSEVPAALAACDLLALIRPSTLQTEFGFSTKLASYMASGVPVIASRVSDNELYLEDQVNGFLLPPGDTQAAKAKLRWICQHAEQLPEVGRRAKECALIHFHYRRYGKVLSDLIFGPEGRSAVNRNPEVVNIPAEERRSV